MRSCVSNQPHARSHHRHEHGGWGMSPLASNGVMKHNPHTINLDTVAPPNAAGVPHVPAAEEAVLPFRVCAQPTSTPAAQGAGAAAHTVAHRFAVHIWQRFK